MMDNTRKRKIVRNFVIGYLLLQVLVIVLYLGFWAVHPGGFVVAENERMSPPPMFPDYQGVTIPYNIAPLNFRIDVPAEKCYAKIEGSDRGCLSITERIRSVLSPRIGNGLPVRIKVKPFL